MPKDFRSFAESNKHVVEENREKAEEFQEIIDRFKDMDGSELMQNLFREATKLKREGKLDASTLNNLRSTIAPFLNVQQQEMLNSLIDAINEQK